MGKLFSLGCLAAIGISILFILVVAYIFFWFLSVGDSGCITEGCVWFD